MTSAGLNSLRQKECQISVKNWIFDDPFHKKGLILVICVLGMIKPSGSVNFLMKWGCWGHWGHWGCWGHWGHWGSRGFKAWKNHYWGLQSHPGVWIHLYFYVLKKRILGRIMKFQIKFWHLFCWRLLRPANAIFLKTGGWNTNIRTSWSRKAP